MTATKLCTWILFVAALSLGIDAGISHLADMGAAHAAALAATSSAQYKDTVDDGGFLALLMSGQYLAGVGAFLVLFVAAIRAGGVRLFPWLGTKAGGLVLGFGSAALLYLGTAWQQGAPVTLGVVGAALAAGWAAAGGWGHIKDLFDWFRGPSDGQVTESKPSAPPAPPIPPNVAARMARRGFLVSAWSTLGLVALRGRAQAQVEPIRVEVVSKDPDRLIMELEAKARRRVSGPLSALAVTLGLTAVGAVALSQVSCGPITNVAGSIVDCTKDHQDEIAALAKAMWDKILNGGSWSEVEARAKDAGIEIGGCALAETVQKYLGGARSVSVTDSQNARGALEHFRATVAGGATFKTSVGDL